MAAQVGTGPRSPGKRPILLLPGQLFRSPLFPEARVELVEADARELRALGTQPAHQGPFRTSR
jgi:hypothetical protein